MHTDVRMERVNTFIQIYIHLRDLAQPVHKNKGFLYM